jgi:hypothetical protein
MAVIELTQGKWMTISDSDVALTCAHKWWAVQLGRTAYYAATKIAGKRVLLHRLLMGLSVGDPLMVDHRDGDGLNNTRENLRLATATINMRNRVRNSNNTSGVSGVHFRAKHGSAGAWVAVACREGRSVTKTFGCLRRGSAAAERLAIAWRKAHEVEYEITVREGVLA